jgi:TetR/AcrR family transcriptional regulator
MAIPAQQMTRRDRNKQRNRQEILSAAQAVFGDKGYHQASIQEIADRADFAVSTLYALFLNKEDLYHQASKDVGRRCGEIFDHAMAKGENEYQKLVNFARAKGDTFRESPDGVRMLEIESLRNPEESPLDGILRIYDRFLIRIRDLFESGIKKGLFADRDPMIMAITLDSATSELIKRSHTQPETFTYDDQIDELIAIFFEPLLLKKP